MDTANLNGDIEPKAIENRFSAAVNVIRSLPKNGKYLIPLFILNLCNI